MLGILQLDRHARAYSTRRLVAQTPQPLFVKDVCKKSGIDCYEKGDFGINNRSKPNASHFQTRGGYRLDARKTGPT